MRVNTKSGTICLFASLIKKLGETAHIFLIVFLKDLESYQIDSFKEVNYTNAELASHTINLLELLFLLY